tara:strand:+ start:41 stop:271 length:231 start_codon:yes stop_codon:yes gene_type:complete
MKNQLWYINADTLESANWPLRVKGDMDQCFDNHTKYVETLNSILETKKESYMMGITYNWCGRLINSLSYGIVEETA